MESAVFNFFKRGQFPVAQKELKTVPENRWPTRFLMIFCIKKVLQKENFTLDNVRYVRESMRTISRMDTSEPRHINFVEFCKELYKISSLLEIVLTVKKSNNRKYCAEEICRIADEVQNCSELNRYGHQFKYLILATQRHERFVKLKEKMPPLQRKLQTNMKKMIPEIDLFINSLRL